MPTAPDAKRALDRLISDSKELTEAAIFDSAGKLLAASTGSAESWEPAAADLFTELDRSGGPVASFHIGSPDGEVIGLRFEGLSVMGVAARYCLGSLIHSDMRMALRDLLAGSPGMNRAAVTDSPDPVA